MRTLNCRYPRLKEWCEAHDISASMLAELSGIYEITAQRLIYHGGGASLDTAQSIADGIGLTIDELFRVPLTAKTNGVNDRKRAQTMIHLTDSDISYIRMMYKQAKDPHKQIGVLADMYVCTKNEIRQLLGLPIVERKHRQQHVKWTPKLDNLLLELQKDGKTNREIAELIGTTIKSVQQRSYRLQTKAKNRLQHGKLQAVTK